MNEMNEVKPNDGHSTVGEIKIAETLSDTRKAGTTDAGKDRFARHDHRHGAMDDEHDPKLRHIW
jgi:hypothetical protein